MSRFIEVTVSGYKILLNLEWVTDVEEISDGSCRINRNGDSLDPDEPYEIVRYMIQKGMGKCETKNQNLR